MQRRQFLLSSGILASAFALSPSSVLAENNTDKSITLIIYESGNNRKKIHSVIKNCYSSHVPELELQKITELNYTAGGFNLKMDNGRQYLAEKIIFSSCNKLEISNSAVSIRNGDRQIQFARDKGKNNDTAGPEFWAFTTARKFDRDKIMPFLKRKKNAFMCVS